MGYTTEFQGAFDLDKPLTKARREYLFKFSDTRRMNRDAKKTKKRPDSVRKAAKLPVGDEGAYFVGETGFAGQDYGPDVIDGNEPPTGQPGLWCKWEPNKEGTKIRWNGMEKFYDYIDWLEYLINHFLEPWGYKLNGTVTWTGENPTDIGKIYVRDNVIEAKPGTINFPSPSWGIDD